MQSNNDFPTFHSKITNQNKTNCTILNQLQNADPIVPFSTFQNWYSYNQPEEKQCDEISLESTKRKRVRKMNKHKHRKALKKMKFTLKKLGRK